MSGLIRQVDAVVVEAAEPEAVFNFFLETLGFPLAWELDRYAQSHISGGVVAGGCEIEVAKYLLWPSGRDDPHIQTLDFEPVDIGASVAELDSRGIGHLPPLVENAGRTIHDVLGERAGTGWTVIALDSPLGEDLYLALVDFGHDAGERRELEQKRLLDTGGGPLGIEALTEVHIVVGDLATQRERWAAIVDPDREIEPGLFRLEGGPDIRLVEKDGTTGMVFRVGDIAATAAALSERQLDGQRGEDWIDIDSDRAFGLRMRFVEGEPH